MDVLEALPDVDVVEGEKEAEALLGVDVGEDEDVCEDDELLEVVDVSKEEDE